jgi:hypothetical protein
VPRRACDLHPTKGMFVSKRLEVPYDLLLPSCSAAPAPGYTSSIGHQRPYIIKFHLTPQLPIGAILIPHRQSEYKMSYLIQFTVHRSSLLLKIQQSRHSTSPYIPIPPGSLFVLAHNHDRFLQHFTAALASIPELTRSRAGESVAKSF